MHSNVDQSAEFFDFAAEYSAKQEAKRQSTPTDHKKERDSVERSAPTEDAPRTAAGPEKEGAEPTEKDVPKVGSRSSSGKVQLAGDGLYSKRTITDQEFEDIIELCEVTRYPQNIYKFSSGTLTDINLRLYQKLG